MLAAVRHGIDPRQRAARTGRVERPEQQAAATSPRLSSRPSKSGRTTTSCGTSSTRRNSAAAACEPAGKPATTSEA